jgi:PadR family transcriptional regulator, regulatory protein PadR
VTVVRDFFRGFVRLYVLRRALDGPVYGMALVDDLRRRGYTLGPGTLYPLLQGLAEQGYLERENRTVGGRVRKYYALTSEGARVLAGARPRILALVEDLLDERSPERLDAAKKRPQTPTAIGRRPLLIRPAALRARLDARRGNERPVVIDVRGGDEYAAGHIPGARHIPVDELDARSGELPGPQLHVTYCNMRHRSDARSVRAATLLRARGHRAQALDGGLPAWVAAGYPVGRGLPA